MATSSRPSPNNLPIALSSFIGRGREIVEIRRLLLPGHDPSQAAGSGQPNPGGSGARLLTLAGSGGSGKTRLAIWVAAELGDAFADGVWLIELASLSDPALVPQAVASVLGIREHPGRPLTESLADYAATRSLLIVLDNCEHLVGACARLAETLLRSCPDVRILATSREPLNIPGETVWIVPSLSIPESPLRLDAGLNAAVLLHYEAIRLFCERAAAISPDFTMTDQNGPAVAEICQRLDGVPLAIELAAARVRALSAEQIAERLRTHDRFRLLTSGGRTAPPRHQTLEAALDWSYALLAETERRLLQRLSVFAGGWTLDAAEAVGAGTAGGAGEGVEAGEVLDILSRLVDKSLVVVDKSDGDVRYRLLETIRQYAHTKLAQSGGADGARDRHLSYFAGWAGRAEPHLTNPDQLVWLQQFEAEHDNLRAALEWSGTADHRAEPGLRLALACGRFWVVRGYLTEGRAHLTACLRRAEAQLAQESMVRASALRSAAHLAYLQSDYPAARALLEESLAIFRAAGPSGRPGVTVALELLGEVATEEGEYTIAQALFEESLTFYRELGDKRNIGDILSQLGWVAMRTGNYARASARLEDALAILQDTGDVRLVALVISGLGEVAVRQGDYQRAARLLEESMQLRRELGDKWGIGTSLGSLGWLALRRRDFQRMRSVLGESLAVRMEIGDRSGVAWCLEKLAEAAGLQRRPDQAARLYGAAAVLRAPLKSVIDPVDQPDYERSLTALRSALGEAGFAAAWSEGSVMALQRVIAHALSEPEALPAAEAASTPVEKEKPGGLTGREREVAVLVAQGMSNREIAGALVVRVKTVETYITRILNKLGFDSRVQIATWAVEKGLAPPALGPTDR
jgi:predicted ATPase/DNA-binding CsgD family transcriptional regulator/Tfp pilus assembly protein PilF